MTPIKGWTDNRRLPRIGKIHLGVKGMSSNGKEYPKAVDYFEVHEDGSTSRETVAAFREVYGEKPDALDIVFPTDDDILFADANYKAYGSTFGLICKGDGEVATARWDAQANGPRPAGIDAGTWANRNTQAWSYMDIPCHGAECPMQKATPPQCKAVMNLQFLLPRVRGIGIWQVDTSSWWAIQNIRNNIDLIKTATGGRIRGLELRLRRVSREVTPPGATKKKVWVLDIYNPLTLAELLSQTAALPAQGLVRLPSPDDEIPEDLFPEPENGYTDVEAEWRDAEDASIEDGYEHQGIPVE